MGKIESKIPKPTPAKWMFLGSTGAVPLQAVSLLLENPRRRTRNAG